MHRNCQLKNSSKAFERKKKKSKIQRNKRLINLNHKHTHTHREFVVTKWRLVLLLLWKWTECADFSIWLFISIDFTSKIYVPKYSCEHIIWEKTVRERGLCLIKGKIPHRKWCCTDYCYVMMAISKNHSQQYNWTEWPLFRQEKNKVQIDEKNLLLEKNSICLQNLHLMRYINFLTVALSLIIISKIPF